MARENYETSDIDNLSDILYTSFHEAKKSIDTSKIHENGEKRYFVTKWIDGNLYKVTIEKI